MFGEKPPGTTIVQALSKRRARDVKWPGRRVYLGELARRREMLDADGRGDLADTAGRDQRRQLPTNCHQIARGEICTAPSSEPYLDGKLAGVSDQAAPRRPRCRYTGQLWNAKATNAC